MTASHEVGHSLGLHHDGLYGQTYHPGDGSGETGWGPIMGAPFGQNVVRWSNGDYAGATMTEDDLSVITKPENGVAFRADDQPDLFTGLATLEPEVSVDGLIESGFDVDAFRIATAGGPVTVEVHPLDPGPNIDLRLKLHDQTEAIVTVLDPDDDLDVVLDAELPAGVYIVRLHGTGNPGVYSAYGSIGQYCIVAHYTPGSDCPADLDGSGDVSVADLLQVLAAWGSGAGDVTGDGTTDVADLLAVLSAWGACA
jgi:hypothetical protein